MFKFECYLSSLARALFSFCFFIQSIYMKHSGIWNTLPQVDNCPRWFHLQASEMVLFVTITIANVVFYWEMVLHVKFLPMDFSFLLCQFAAESISLHVVPGGSSSFLLLVCTEIITIERQKDVNTMRLHQTCYSVISSPQYLLIIWKSYLNKSSLHHGRQY